MLIRYLENQAFTSTPPQFQTPDHLAQFEASTQTITQMRDGILRSVPQHVGLVPSSRKPFQNTILPSNSTPPPLPDLSEFDFNLDNLDLNLDIPLSFTDLLASPNFTPFEDPSFDPIPDPSFPKIGGYFLLWPIYVAAITRVSLPVHRAFASTVLAYIGENMGIRQATNMVSFLNADPVFQQMRPGMEKGKESAAMDEIKGWRKEMPIQPLREMFEREDKEQAMIRAAGEKLARESGYLSGVAAVGPSR
jgi:hypothetical protein